MFDQCDGYFSLSQNNYQNCIRFRKITTQLKFKN